MRTSPVKILIGFFLICLPHLSWALGMDDFEMNHTLSVGAGIASPSVTSSLFENPAGLSYNLQTKFLAEGGSTNNNFNPIGLGGLFFLGNGFVGGGIGVQTFNGQGDNAGLLTQLDFGIAAEISSMNISFGATGSYLIQRSGFPQGAWYNSNWSSDVGLIYNPRGEVRLGVTAFNVINGVDAIALGIAGDASSWATFVLDGSMNPRTATGKVLKPAMGIHLMDFQFTLGYGLPLDNGSDNWIRRYSSFGLGIRLSYNWHFQAYYNQLALYYLGLTVKF